MAIKKTLTDIPSFLAGDHTVIKEILHPKNGDPKDNYSLAHASLAPGEQSLSHRLMTMSEVYFILSGKGRAYINEETFDLEVGDTLYICAGDTQWIKNTGDTTLNFLCIVSPPWQKENEEVDT